MTIFVFACLGLFGGVISGLLGVGGAIIMIPLMLVVPPLFGLPALTMNQVSGLSMVQVFFASLSGVATHRSSGHVNVRLTVAMGGGFACATFLGAICSGHAPARLVGIVFATMATISVPLILIRRKPAKPEGEEGVDGEEEKLEFSLPAAIAASAVVGSLAGLVGAGGGFMLIPVMLFFLRIPLRIAIANSLGIVLIGSVTGVIGKAIAGQIDYKLAAVLSCASLTGAIIGAKVSAKLPKKMLKGLLLAIVIYSAVQSWIKFAKPAPPQVEKQEPAAAETQQVP